MPTSTNIFRLAGDFAHIFSKFVLIWSIHRNKSAEGISAMTQGMYAMVFSKLFYLASSFYILLVMLKIYPYTQESRQAWIITAYSFGGSVLLSVPLTGFVRGWWWGPRFLIAEMFWTFSIILESICVIPQLIILRETDIPTVINSHYLLALGSYRAFYILNWIYRYVSEGVVDPIAVTFGVIQTALYIDFARVYYGRQRIKLRDGALVDSQDFKRGWITRWFSGEENIDLERGEENDASDPLIPDTHTDDEPRT